MTQTIFADGFAKISVVNNVVRVDLVEIDPVPSGANQEKQIARLLLPLNMMPALLADLNRVVGQASTSASGMSATAPQPAPAPASNPGLIPAPPLGPPPRWTPKS